MSSSIYIIKNCRVTYTQPFCLMFPIESQQQIIWWLKKKVSKYCCQWSEEWSIFIQKPWNISNSWLTDFPKTHFSHKNCIIKSSVQCSVSCTHLWYLQTGSSPSSWTRLAKLWEGAVSGSDPLALDTVIYRWSLHNWKMLELLERSVWYLVLKFEIELLSSLLTLEYEYFRHSPRLNPLLCKT